MTHLDLELLLGRPPSRGGETIAGWSASGSGELRVSSMCRRFTKARTDIPKERRVITEKREYLSIKSAPEFGISCSFSFPWLCISSRQEPAIICDCRVAEAYPYTCCPSTISLRGSASGTSRDSMSLISITLKILQVLLKKRVKCLS